MEWNSTRTPHDRPGPPKQEPPKNNANNNNSPETGNHKRHLPPFCGVSLTGACNNTHAKWNHHFSMKCFPPFGKERGKKGERDKRVYRRWCVRVQTPSQCLRFRDRFVLIYSMSTPSVPWAGAIDGANQMLILCWCVKGKGGRRKYLSASCTHTKKLATERQTGGAHFQRTSGRPSDPVFPGANAVSGPYMCTSVCVCALPFFYRWVVRMVRMRQSSVAFCKVIQVSSRKSAKKHW